MIRIKGLKKSYGNFEALHGISFEIKPSKITAILGPNGAGKTTILRILSGYIDYDEGEIEFFDKKVTDDNIKEIKKIIGYVAENNPIYEDLEVVDYLNWISDIYRVDRRNVREVIDKCSLKDVCGRKIATLSKGYKQRVSLAKAILHNPQFLLLDEPTTGLDPNQARQTRELIKTLSKDKTIVISTHILSEVETLADDIVIINRGSIAAYGTKDEILKSYSANAYIIKTPIGEELKIEGAKIEKTQSQLECVWRLEFDTDEDMRAKLIEELKKDGVNFFEFYREKITLDEIFRRITED